MQTRKGAKAQREKIAKTTLYAQDYHVPWQVLDGAEDPIVTILASERGNVCKRYWLQRSDSAWLRERPTRLFF